MRHSTSGLSSCCLVLCFVLTAANVGAGCDSSLAVYPAGPAAAIVRLTPQQVALATGGRIELLDLGAAATPTVLGELDLAGTITALDVVGDVLWVTADPPRLLAVDIADPAHPELLASHRLPSYPYHVAADSARVVVAVDRHVLAFDTPSPGVVAAARLVGSACHGYPGGIDLVGDLLYLGAYDAKQLEIWDLDAGAQPLLLGAEPLMQPIGRVAVIGTVAAVGGYGIDLVDVSDPTRPVKLATTGDEIEDTAGPFDLVDERLVFTTWRTCRLWVVDISDPAAPSVVSRGGEYCDSRAIAALEAGFAIAAGAAGMRVSRHGEAALWPTFGHTSSVDLAGELVVFGDDGGSVGILAIGADGLELRGALDLVADDPSELAQVLVAAADDRAVAVHANSISMLDLSDPAAPLEATRLPASGAPIGAALSGDLAYVAIGTELLVVDVTDGAAATILGAVDHALIAQSLALGDGWVAVTGVYSGAVGHLALIDVSSPTAPRVVTTLNLASQCHGVAVKGDLVVIAADDAGLLLVDVADLTAPHLLGAIPLGDTIPARGVWLDGSVAWVSAGAGAGCPLRRINLADPATPVDLGCVPDLTAADLAFAGGRLAIARGAAGIAVAPQDCWSPAVAAAPPGNSVQ